MSKRRIRSSDSDNIEVINPSKQRISKSHKDNMDEDGESTLPVNTGEQSSDITSEFNTNEKTLLIVSQIQSKLDSFISKLDRVSDDVNKLKDDIRKKDGIEERLENVCCETGDQTAEIAELKSENKKLSHEMKIMKSYIIRLEQRVNNNTSDIINQSARGMRNNLIITGVKESDGENLFETVNNIIVNELKLDPVKFDRVHRIGPKTNKTFPRSIVGKCFDYAQRERVLKNTDKLKGDVRIYPQFPESHRESRKRAKDLQKRYNEEHIETKVVGDKLIFKGSGNLHKEKVVIPKADSVLTTEVTSKAKIVHGDLVTDGENSFQAHAAEIKNIKEAREATLQILQNPEVAKANHNVLACVYVNNNGELKDSMDDDGEYGAARKILNVMHEKEVANMLIVISRWNPYSQKLGPRRFDHFKSSALNVMRKLLVN